MNILLKRPWECIIIKLYMLQYAIRAKRSLIITTLNVFVSVQSPTG